MNNILGENLLIFSSYGNILLLSLFFLSLILGLIGVINLFSAAPYAQKTTTFLLVSINFLFIVGFLLICWFHFNIYQKVTLTISPEIIDWLNMQLKRMNARSYFPIPLYDPSNPPRYTIPLWIEAEKYYFWFMCYGAVALIAHIKSSDHKFRATLHIFLLIQVSILLLATNPFSDVLPQFLNEITPWLEQSVPPMERLGLFMKLYPKMIFYYNASYMWFHPPLLFLAYASITVTFACSIFMLVRREVIFEKLGYDFAKVGFYVLTIGMLLGYPWALKAWGPNWWWDPKICSSIMMWVTYSTYLHTRLYGKRRFMWYFTAFLGIICFVAMIFTFLSSFFFPGEHTFQ